MEAVFSDFGPAMEWAVDKAEATDLQTRDTAVYDLLALSGDAKRDAQVPQPRFQNALAKETREDQVRWACFAGC